ncbi:MAG: glycosyltransferase family 9 protein [Deltaproteobacteria bacterium]|nr:glycosyltransferase family 9 protein [Deltaproteobacteria bacterium]MCL5791961.1 glycosyltransferase family 9 protein [Deltaproteobacteria bacterium]
MEDVKGILIIHTGQIGDNLLTTPVIRSLRKAMPDSYIAFLTSKPDYHVFSFNHYLNEIILLDKSIPLMEYARFLFNLRKRRFDLALDFLGNPRTAFITWFSNARYRIGYDLRLRRYAYNYVVERDKKPKYSVNFKYDLLKAIDINGDDISLDLFIPESARIFAQEFIKSINTIPGPIFTISPVSRRAYKQWHAEKFALLSDMLIERFHAKLIFLWGPGEKAYVQQIIYMMKNKPHLSPQTPTIKELGALIKLAVMHIGNDNGIKHIAIAMGTPTVTIHGPSDPVSWEPPGSKINVWIKKDAGCGKCVPKRCKHDLKCLDAIKPHDVLNEVEKLYNGIHAKGLLHVS